MSSGPLYTKPIDEELATATVTLVTGTADPDYPVTELVNGNPARPFKSTAHTVRVVFDFGSPMTLSAFAVINHNVDPLGDMKLEANATNSWGSPSHSGSFYVNTSYPVGFMPNTWIDLRLTLPSYRYWSVVVTGNSVNVILGQMVAYGVMYDFNLLAGKVTYADQRATVQHKTPYDVTLTYDRGTNTRLYTGSIIATGATEILSVKGWYQACRGMSRPFLIIPSQEDNPPVEPLYVRWDINALTASRGEHDNDYQVFPGNWREVSRGLPLLDS